MSRETEYFLSGFGAGVSGLALLLFALNTTPRQVEEKMEKAAIQHKAARYEVDTNGIVTFKWNK